MASAEAISSGSVAVMSASGLELGYGFERGPLDTRSKYRKRKPRQRRMITRRAVFDQTLTACDIVTLLAAFAASYWIAVHLLQVKLHPLDTYLWLLWVIVPAWLVTSRWFGLNDPATYSSEPRVLLQLIRSYAVAVLLLLSTMWATKAEEVSRLLTQTFLLVAFAALAGEKLALKSVAARWRRRRAFYRPKVLLIGTLEKANDYLDLLRRDLSMAAEVIGLLAPHLAQSEPHSHAAAPIIGCPADLLEVLNHHVVDEVVAVLPIEQCDLNWVAASCATRGLVMRMLVQVPQSRVGWQVNDCGDGSLFLSAAAVPQDAFQIAGKRILDIAGAIAGLAVVGLAWALYGWRLRCETGASVMFRQPRVGQNGRLFTLYKFRTMYHDAEQRLHELTGRNEMKGPMFKLKDDPRVTPTGSKLRRRHIDELPQFWNVLKGEMSLVGTRPPTQDEVASYLDVHRRRLSMKPGLTGLWQLHGNDIVNDFEEVVKLDCQYIRNWSLRLDLRIILHTVRKILRADGY